MKAKTAPRPPRTTVFRPAELLEVDAGGGVEVAEAPPELVGTDEGTVEIVVFLPVGDEVAAVLSVVAGDDGVAEVADDSSVPEVGSSVPVVGSSVGSGAEVVGTPVVAVGPGIPGTLKVTPAPAQSSTAASTVMPSSAAVQPATTHGTRPVMKLVALQIHAISVV